MSKQTHPTLPSRTLSLLPLQSALIAAARDTPAHPPRLSRDPDELLAVTLIERIKHPPSASFIGLRIESPQPLEREVFLEMAGSHVG